MSENTNPAPRANNPAPIIPPNFLISAQVAQALLAYLGKQPYQDVAGFVQFLSTMKQANFPPKAPDHPGGATGNNGQDAAQTNKDEVEKT